MTSSMSVYGISRWTCRSLTYVCYYCQEGGCTSDSTEVAYLTLLFPVNLDPAVEFASITTDHMPGPRKLEIFMFTFND